MFYAYAQGALDLGLDPTKRSKSVTVSSSEVVLSGLQACEAYVAKVAITAPGVCPLSAIETFHTGEGKFRVTLTFKLLEKGKSVFVFFIICFVGKIILR